MGEEGLAELGVGFLGEDDGAFRGTVGEVAFEGGDFAGLGERRDEREQAVRRSEVDGVPGTSLPHGSNGNSERVQKLDEGDAAALGLSDPSLL